MYVLIYANFKNNNSTVPIIITLEEPRFTYFMYNSLAIK